VVDFQVAVEILDPFSLESFFALVVDVNLETLWLEFLIALETFSAQTIALLGHEDRKGIVS